MSDVNDRLVERLTSGDRHGAVCCSCGDLHSATFGWLRCLGPPTVPERREPEVSYEESLFRPVWDAMRREG